MDAPAFRARHPWRTTVVAGMASYLDAGAITTLGTVIGFAVVPRRPHARDLEPDAPTADDDRSSADATDAVAATPHMEAAS